jgi:hypothetical protein
MARAGFYAVDSGKISFRRDGNWYSDEERIDNPRIAELFSRSIHRNADGSFYLQVAEERAPITVEDTPYVVKAVDGDCQAGFIITANDNVSERLSPSTLEVAPDHVLYCTIKGGKYRARFLRSAYYQLAKFFEPDPQLGFALTVSGRRYPVRHAASGKPRSPSTPGRS